MNEAAKALVSLIPVGAEAAVAVPPLFDKFERFSEMMARFPQGAISPELYFNKLHEALGPQIVPLVVLAVGTFLTAEILIHLVPALLSRRGHQAEAPTPTPAPEPPKTTTVTVGGAPLAKPWDYQG